MQTNKRWGMPSKLRWKREAKNTGLSAIGAAPRGYVYHDGDIVYAVVSPSGGGWRGHLLGWYWVAGWGSSVPSKNTCNDPCETVEEAKNQAKLYVLSHLAGVK